MKEHDDEIDDKDIEPELLKESVFAFLKARSFRVLITLFLFFSALWMLFAFINYTFNWKSIQSFAELPLDQLLNLDEPLKNGALSNRMSHFFIYKQIGISAVFLPVFIVLASINVLLDRKLIKLSKYLKRFLFFSLFLPVAFAFLFDNPPVLFGKVGYFTEQFLRTTLGSFGLGLLLLFFALAYLVLVLSFDLKNLKLFSKSDEDNNGFEDELAEESEDLDENVLKSEHNIEENLQEDAEEELVQPVEGEALDLEIKTDQTEEKKAPQDTSLDQDLEVLIPEEEKLIDLEEQKKTEDEEQTDMAKLAAEDPKAAAAKLTEAYGEYDPTSDLGHYLNPELGLMKEYSDSKPTINQEELNANKNKIVETLNNYKIGIASIKATIGPTITLYEIVPAPGVRISKIKGLENDIALSLAALGIRIIAPLPGRGTVGIEVPNLHPKIVSMKSVLMSEKFQKSNMDLPVALGKTISNETFVVDLAKMPHLLMAGATGQGKSVGLNCILASLLYKKHPAELKLVLVDPKKVELTLFNHIERHFLAKLPGEGEAIITDNKEVINTINSLCVEMDARYDLLKAAHCRNLKEYNTKFKSRRLSPEKGHRFLPYIVLVVDEFADLIMTAGKEVELPIARLAQLARAIGIHLIIATQRPTTNIITGTIKANFPARIAFRVTSTTDSRTILDAGGANQLIGRGDMLFSNGNDITRLQCAFIDTPEVELLCEYIGNQKGYSEPFYLPEYVGDETEKSTTADLEDRDVKFEDAARVVVLHQQGSTSLVQRKLKLGYNRAGRIIDQLEAVGIVGPFEGSKARKVLIPDEVALEQYLKELNG
ncbi:MAG: DNA translocase FtsK 4TM domain-containing protein [Flavobacteriales bacterium]